jgi:hypothetical protein
VARTPAHVRDWPRQIRETTERLDGTAWCDADRRARATRDHGFPDLPWECLDDVVDDQPVRPMVWQRAQHLLRQVSFNDRRPQTQGVGQHAREPQLDVAFDDDHPVGQIRISATHWLALVAYSTAGNYAKVSLNR